MKYKEMIKNNMKFIIVLIIVIALGVIGITYAVTYNATLNVNLGTANLGANIEYLNGSSANIVSSDKLIPINDSTEITPSTTSENVLKVDFKVSGVSSNPENTIMDISLNSMVMDCELYSDYFKWKLYKNNELLSNGNFSFKFDTMPNRRLVLTNIQEDLTTTADTYSLIIYIADSCTGNVSNCDSSQDQRKLLNKEFSAIIKLELSTGKKKNNTRRTSSEDACSFSKVNVPTCNTVSYDGTSKTLISTNTKYTLNNNTGINAGNYAVVAKLNDGYKWSDNTFKDKIINCSIGKKELTITAANQTISEGSYLNNSTSKITTSGLASGDTVSSIHLYTPQLEKGTGVIYASAVKIVNASNSDVTANYNITYNNGVVTIN